MESTAAPDTSAAHTRAIRHFAHREDAERAKTALADSNISCTIREFRVPDPLTGKLTSRGCSLNIDPADAAAAARLLLKMPPSEAPGAVNAPVAKPESPSRLRRRGGKPERQRSSAFIVGFAVCCAAGMIAFATSGIFGPKKSKGPVSRANHLVEEDLNGDTLPDVSREFTWDWVPINHSEDRNFDTLWDCVWTYQHGKPAYRELDLNFDGRIDERTVFDPEGQPFYIDTRPGMSGPVIKRRIFRDSIIWKVLEDRDADTHFDHLMEYNELGETVRDEEVPRGSPENNLPVWPPPPAPEPEELDPAMIPGATHS